MYKAILALFSLSSLLMAGCAVEAGESGEADESVSSVDQALKAVIFKGGGNTGFSNETDKTATIAADNSSHVSAKGGIGIDLKVDNTSPFDAGSVTSADCPKHTVTVTYKQADIQQFTKTTPPASVHNGRCIATVTLEWSSTRAPGTVIFPNPSLAASQQRVLLSSMPITPAVGNISVVTKTNGVANTDKYAFRVDPAQ